MTQNKSTAFPLSYKLILIAYCLIALLLGGWFVKNFIAERHYREGYLLLSISKTAKYNQRPTIKKRLVKNALEHYIKMVGLSPWEPHYGLQLGKALDHYALLVEPKDRQIVIQSTLPIYIKIEQQNNHSPWYKNKLYATYTKLSQLAQTKEKKELYAKKAFNYAKAAYEADHLNPIFIQLYAQQLHNSGQLDEALVLYKKGLDIDDRILGIQLNIANIYLVKGHADLAIQEYLAIYEKSPTYNKIGLQIGQLYTLTNHPNKALPFLLTEYEKTPFNLQVLQTLGATYMTLKDWSLAHKYLQEFIDLNPNVFPVIKQQTVVLRALHKPKTAKRLLRGFIKQNPKHKDAKTLLTQL